jgi:hypothetical protein
MHYAPFRTVSVLFAIAFSVLFMDGTALATSGCCSWHGGVASCSGGYYQCVDGTQSPSCTCSSGTQSPEMTVRPVTPADDELFYRQLNAPKNTTGSCQSRYGKGAIAGKLDCECIGGYKWTAGHDACIADGTKVPTTNLDRIAAKIKSKPVPKVIKKLSGSSASSSVSSIGAVKSSCVIKGNISSTKEKIYHLPGCVSYSATIIEVSKGERMFCTEQEAVAAGWRKALNCPK